MNLNKCAYPASKKKAANMCAYSKTIKAHEVVEAPVGLFLLFRKLFFINSLIFLKSISFVKMHENPYLSIKKFVLSR